MYLPWWLLLAGLAASAFATYVLLGRTRAGDSPWVLFPLAAALTPGSFPWQRWRVSPSRS